MSRYVVVDTLVKASGRSKLFLRLGCDTGFRTVQYMYMPVEVYIDQSWSLAFMQIKSGLYVHIYCHSCAGTVLITQNCMV